jgi:hypothetical protein
METLTIVSKGWLSHLNKYGASGVILFVAMEDENPSKTEFI